jgi:hypothetical protein
MGGGGHLHQFIWWELMGATSTGSKRISAANFEVRELICGSGSCDERVMPVVYLGGLNKLSGRISE